MKRLSNLILSILVLTMLVISASCKNIFSPKASVDVEITVSCLTVEDSARNFIYANFNIYLDNNFIKTFVWPENPNNIYTTIVKFNKKLSKGNHVLKIEVTSAEKSPVYPFIMVSYLPLDPDFYAEPEIDGINYSVENQSISVGGFWTFNFKID